MEHDAWKKISFDYPRAVPTMLAHEEKRYLYWLGKTVWGGDGVILEIGPWLGGSTVCLAAGMRASGHDTRGKLHTVDNFLWRDFMSARAPLSLRDGESFQLYFLKNVAAYSDIVMTLAAALPDETVDPGAPLLFDGVPGSDPISILFIDGAKSWRGMRHLLRVCANRLQPGTSVLVCQDFKIWSACWVPMMMARFADVVVPIHNVLNGTTVSFRLERPIPPSVLATLEDGLDAVDAGEGLRLLNRAVEWLAKDGDTLGAAHVDLARVRFLSHLGIADEATREFVKIQSRWPSRRDVSQLVLASAFLRRSGARTIPRPISISLSWQRQKLMGAWRKHVTRR